PQTGRSRRTPCGRFDLSSTPTDRPHCTPYLTFECGTPRSWQGEPPKPARRANSLGLDLLLIHPPIEAGEASTHRSQLARSEAQGMSIGDARAPRTNAPPGVPERAFLSAHSAVGRRHGTRPACR